VAVPQPAVRQPQAHNWWTYPDPSGDIPLGYEQAADFVAAHEEPTDGVAFQVSDENRWEVDSGVLYYPSDRKAPVTVFQSQIPWQVGLLVPVECAYPARCLFGARRLWVVHIQHMVSHGLGGTPFQALPPAATATRHADGYRVRQTYNSYGISISLLTIGGR
jgi:mannosyltransferase